MAIAMLEADTRFVSVEERLFFVLFLLTYENPWLKTGCDIGCSCHILLTLIACECTEVRLELIGETQHVTLATRAAAAAYFMAAVVPPTHCQRYFC